MKDFSLEHPVPYLDMSMTLDSLTDYKVLSLNDDELQVISANS